MFIFIKKITFILNLIHFNLLLCKKKKKKIDISMDCPFNTNAFKRKFSLIQSCIENLRNRLINH